MNKDKRVATDLLLTALKIIEEYNPGESVNYFARNAIAKYSLANEYYLTTQKMKDFASKNGIDISKRSSKQPMKLKKLYGEAYTFEHAIPAVIILEKLNSVFVPTDSLEDNMKKVLKILEYSNVVAILTSEENDILKQNKLNSKMPKDWKFFDNVFARYDAVGIKLLDEKIQMTGALKR